METEHNLKNWITTIISLYFQSPYDVVEGDVLVCVSVEHDGSNLREQIDTALREYGTKVSP